MTDPIQTVERATVEPKRLSDGNKAEVEPQEDDGGKQQKTIRREQSYVHYLLGRQSSDSSSAPGWVQDLKRMLVKWKEQLDEQIKESQRLTNRISTNEGK